MSGDAAEPTPSRELRGPDVLADPLVRELLRARLVAVVTTLEPDGSVHAVPMWFARDDACVVLATGSRSRKVRNVRRDPRVTVVVHDSRPGYEVCGASIRGRAEVVTGAEGRRLVRLVHDRYLTDAAARLPAASAFLASDDVAIRIEPEVAVTWDERRSDAAREVRDAGAALPLEPTSPRP